MTDTLLPASQPTSAEAEAALSARSRASETDAAMDWLDQFAGASPQQSQVPASPAGEEGVWGAVKGVGRDLARGAVEAPRQILGGVRDAVQSAIDLGDWVADSLEKMAPLGGVQLFDERGGFAPGYIAPGDPRLAPDKTGGTLPAVKEAQSVTGGVVRSVAQFLTGFAGAGAAMGGAMAGAPVARSVVQGALADATAFGAHDQRLSNLIEDVPALKNPVTAYLAAAPDDGEAEGRLKNAIEGMALGGMTEGLLRAIRYVRDARRAAGAADPEAAAARVKAEPPEARPLDLLGDEKRPLVEVDAPAPPKPDPTADLGVPSDVAARGVAGRAEDVRRGVLKIAGDEDAAGLRGQLRDTFDAATEKSPSAAGRIVIGDISPEGAADINALLKEAGVDLDVSGFRHEADAYAARHAVKEHGDAAKELPRGQLPVTADDWSAIPDILSGPDRLEYVGKTRQGRDAVGYWKQVNGHVLYIEEVRTGRGTLAAVTMRKFKGKLEEIAPGRPDGEAPQSHVRNALPGRDNVVEPGIRINFARIDTTDDVKVVLADMADAFRDDIETARRGVRSNAATAEAAGDEDAWKLISERRQGQPWNAEEALAARRMWEASGAKLLDVAQAAAAHPTTENLFQFRKMMAIHHEVQREVVAARTETARALQSWKIPAGGGGAERLRSIENVLLTYGGSEAAQEMAKRISALAKLPGSRAMIDDVVEKGAFAKSLDTVKEVWINALLSNPKTHAVNMIGNGLTVGLSMLERAGAAGWSQAIGSGEILPGEAAAHAFGLSQGIREGLRMFWQAMRLGESQFGASTTKSEQGFQKAVSGGYWKIDPDNWVGKAVDGLGFLVNLPTRALGAEDDFFKSIGYRMEVNAQAFRQASREVQDGLLPRESIKMRVSELSANPPENIRLAATDAALYNTFTSKPGRLVEAIGHLDRAWQNGSPGEKLGAFAMRMLIPFRNTPAAIMRYAFERTPMAPLMSRYREAVAQGGAAADLARTRMALGTFVLLGTMDLALDGQISGGGPRSDRRRGDRDALQRSGWQPYSVKVGDRWVSYARTDPVGLTLGIAADIAEIVSNADLDAAKADDLFEVVAGAAAAFGNQVLDKTYMSGLSGFVDALHNPNKAAGFVERIGAGFVPAAVNEVRRQVDPYMRYTHDLTTQLTNRIPGLSPDLPVARDFWGRPKTYQSGLGTIYDAISPLAARTFNPEAIDREAITHGFNISMPDWELGSVKLRNQPELYSRLLEVRGTMKPSEMGGKEGARLVKKYGDTPLLPLLNDIVEGRHPLSEPYKAASGGAGGGKDDLVTKIVRDFTKAARGRVREERPELGN